MRCPNGALQKQKKAYNEDVGSNGPTSMIPWLDHPDSGAVIKPASKTPPYCMSSMGIIFETSNDGQSGILDLRPCKKRMWGGWKRGKIVCQHPVRCMMELHETGRFGSGLGSSSDTASSKTTITTTTFAVSTGGQSPVHRRVVTWCDGNLKMRVRERVRDFVISNYYWLG